MTTEDGAPIYDLMNADIPEMANRATTASPNHPLISGLSTEAMLVEKDVHIPLKDGTYLVCDVFRPRPGGRYPILLTSGPYGKDIPFSMHWPYEYARSGEQGNYMTIETVNPESWVDDGYAVVRVDQAGTGKSPGVVDVWSPRDTSYFYEAIEWAGIQTWSTGKVGLIGISYYSATQFAVAALKPPHLAAIIPWEVGYDLYREFSRNGGILANAFVDFWFDFWVLSNQYGRGVLSDEEVSSNIVDFRESIRAHEFLDDYWTDRVANQSAIDVPMFTAGNWAGAAMTLRSHVESVVNDKSNARWLRIHTGGHIEPFYESQARSEQKLFFDYFLRGIENSQPDIPPIHLAIRTGRSVAFRYEHEWPLARTDWTTLYLDAADDLSLSNESVVSRGESTFSAEVDSTIWRPMTSYNDALSIDDQPPGRVSSTFMSAPFSSHTEITGPINLSLTVSCSVGDTDLFVAVRDYDAEGNEIVVDGVDNPATPVTLGWLRLSHREIDQKHSTPWRPVLRHACASTPDPDQIVDVQIEVGPTSWVFERGHRLALEIGSRDLPGAFPFLHNDPQDRRTGGTVTIYTGPGTHSSILLPVVPARSHSESVKQTGIS